MEIKANIADLIAQFSRLGWGFIDDFLPAEPCDQLLQLAQLKNSQGYFRPAQIGSAQQRVVENQVRSDEILWIDDWHIQPLLGMQQQLQELQAALKQCYFPCRRFESHFAHYSKGSFYIRHKDQHQNNPHRLVTAVLYLSDWSPEFAGELVLHPPDQQMIQIEPRQARMAIFESSLDHEVLPTRADRWSITTWFRDDLMTGYAL